MSLTLDGLYGCNLGEYLKQHNKTKEALINEIEIDIKILTKNYEKYSHNNQNYTVQELIKYGLPVSKLIDKKKLHLKRIQEWKGV